jgi:hypothetical protein
MCMIKLLLALALPLGATDLYKASLPLYLGAATADIASSWGLQERNPLLGQGTFGPRQALRSAAITGGVVLGAHLAQRRWPALRRPLGWVLLVATGTRGGVAVHNARLHR